MFCKICNREFKTSQGLVSHLSNKKSKCHTNIKDYYDKFLRQPNEGICKYCQTETFFYGLSVGYKSTICSTCNRKNIDIEKNLKRSQSLKRTLKKKKELTDQRKILIEILRKRTIDKTNKKQCQICGLTFFTLRTLTRHLRSHKITTKEYYNKYFKSQHEDICLCYGIDSCKKISRFISFEKGYSDYCSTKCVSLSPIILNKKEKTCLNKYGVTHPTKDPIINQKQKKGINKIIKERNPDIIKQREKTCLKKYGVRHISQYKPIEDRRQNSLKKHRKSESYQVSRKKQHNTFLTNTFFPRMDSILKREKLKLLEEYKGAHRAHQFQCIECETITKTLWNSITGGFHCKKCHGSRTKPEQEMNDWLQSINIKFISGDRFQISPYELDMFIFDKNLAIEYCGLYHHSELVNTKNPQDYHKNKLNLCRKKNIRLIQVFGDEWKYKKDIVKKRLEYILGVSQNQRIHARKCLIKEISPKEKNIFLERNHIQGKDTSTIKLGAFYVNDLVAVMTFSKGRLSKNKKYVDGNWELNRFANDFDYIIPGIASKLLIFFQRNYYWNTIYSFADLRWSLGDVYKKLSFDLAYETRPGYWYFKNYQRYHRFGLRKRPDEPKDIPEWLLRHQQGYFRIWDCGLLKFVKENKKREAI